MAAAAVISMVGYNAGNALGCPRLLSALAHDRHLPAVLASPHPRFETPSLAILLTAGITATAALCLTFERLVDLANFAVILQYLATCAAFIRLRRTRPATARLFRAPFGMPVALAGCVVSLWLAREVSGVELGWAAGVIGLGFLASAGFHLARFQGNAKG